MIATSYLEDRRIPTPRIICDGFRIDDVAMAPKMTFETSIKFNAPKGNLVRFCKRQIMKHRWEARIRWENNLKQLSKKLRHLRIVGL